MEALLAAPVGLLGDLDRSVNSFLVLGRHSILGLGWEHVQHRPGRVMQQNPGFKNRFRVLHLVGGAAPDFS